MVRYRLILVILVVWYLPQLTAQNFTPAGNIFFADVLEKAGVNPSNYLYLPVKNYTKTGIFYTVEGGDLSDTRIPSQMQDFGLETEGVFKNDNGVIYFGNLSIAKSYYKNLKWNLSYQLPEYGLMEDPHYFGVSRPGNWSNQDYDINGGVLFPIADRWHVLAEVNYHLFNKFRNDRDPRSEIKYNQLIFHAGLTYQVSDTDHLKIKGNYGAADITNEIDFNNIDNDIPKNYTKYVKWLIGYGTFSNPFENSTMRNYHQVGLSIGYARKTTDYDILLDIDYLRKKYDTYKENNQEIKHQEKDFFSEYTPKTYSLHALVLKKQTENSHLKLQFSGDYTTAENRLQNKGGKSYSSSLAEMNMVMGYLKTDQSKPITDIGLGLGYTRSEQQDAVEQSQLKFSYLQPNFYILKRFKLSPDLAFLPKLASQVNLSIQYENLYPDTSYLDNIDDRDFYGLTRKLFYEEVTLPNAELFAASNWQTSIDLGFNFKSFQNLDTYFNVAGSYQQSFEQLDHFETETPHRWMVSASLKVYY